MTDNNGDNSFTMTLTFTIIHPDTHEKVTLGTQTATIQSKYSISYDESTGAMTIKQNF